MEGLVLQGRGVMGGVVRGQAIVCPNSITGWGGIDPVTGVIKDYDNIHRGESIQGKILIIPGSKGSNGWSCYFSITRVSGANPIGLVITRIDSSSAVAAVGMNVPTIADFSPDTDPCQLIQTGDIVEMDGQTGRITVIEAIGG